MTPRALFRSHQRGLIRRGRRRVQRCGRGPLRQAGFTLVELLVTMGSGIVVLSATSTMLITGMQSQVSLQNRVNQDEQAQTALQRVIHDLREATSVTYVSSSSLTYVDPSTSGGQTVSFACSTTSDSC